MDLRTWTDPGDDGDGDTWLYATVCLSNGECCEPPVLDGPWDDYERGNLDKYRASNYMGNMNF